MIEFSGFNVGIKISLGDMEAALDYINDSEIYKDDLDEIKRSKLNKYSDVDTINYSNNELELVGGVEKTGIALLDGEENDYGDVLDEDDYDDDMVDEVFGDGDEDYEEEYEDYEEEIDGYEEEYEDYEEADVSNIGDKYTTLKTKSQREIELERQIEEMREYERNRLAEERRERELAEAKRQHEIELNEQRQRENKLKEELELMKKKIKLSEDNVRSTTNKDVVRKDKHIKKPVAVAKSEQDTQKVGLDYSSMDIDTLWQEVRKFMISSGVASKLVSRSSVEQQFGAQNIKQLYARGYLIPFGSKLTIGK